MTMTVDGYFLGQEESRQLFEMVHCAVKAIGPVELRVSKSQIAFRRRKAFVWLWMPGKYLRGKTAPMMLTFSFRYRGSSPRWASVVEPAPGRITHHLELDIAAVVDDEVRVR